MRFRADRWDASLYYDPDHAAPDKTYSTIGGWVREFPWEPMKWHLAVPPRVVDAMDDAQKWAIACTREALDDYGYPKRTLNTERTAVILGNAMAGEKHYFTALRLYFPEYARELAESSSFAALPEAVRRAVTEELHRRIGQRCPEGYGRHHAGRTGQLHRRSHCEYLQLSRSRTTCATRLVPRRWRPSVQPRKV